MASNEKTSWEPGALVQIRRDVQGAGDIGIVIGPTDGLLWRSSQCLDVLFGEGIRLVHPSNLQVPRARRPAPPHKLTEGRLK